MIDTSFALFDTGGAEAMVQLALAVAKICGRSVYRGFAQGLHVINAPGRIAPRLLAQYPAIEGMPRLRSTADLQRGDMVIVPETRQCDESFAKRGVHWYLWLLSARARRYNWRNLQRGCRVLSHSRYLAHDTRAGITLPASFMLRPYITPATVAFCRGAHRQLRPQPGDKLARPVVLLDADVPTAIEKQVGQICQSTTGCNLIRVTNVTRERVHELLERASAMVDWCMPGTERLAVEAVLCGAVTPPNRSDPTGPGSPTLVWRMGRPRFGALTASLHKRLPSFPEP